jgi:hypothetical protein
MTNRSSWRSILVVALAIGAAADGKRRGNLLLRHASDCRFLPAFSSCHLDTSASSHWRHGAIEAVKPLLKSAANCPKALI